MKQRIHEFKLFRESIEDVVCKVKRNPQEYLESAKWLHKSLQNESRGGAGIEN